MGTRVYYVTYLEPKTTTVLSAADIKQAGKAAERILPKGSVITGVYTYPPKQKEESNTDPLDKFVDEARNISVATKTPQQAQQEQFDRIVAEFKRWASKYGN